jgi:hemolysin III
MSFRHYTNEYVSAATHGIGLGLSIAGLVLLLYWAARYGTAWHIVAFALFGASLIGAYAASVFYHLIADGRRAKEVWRRFDHAMIYFLIAGTYMPIVLVPLRGGWGWSLFGVIWGLAFVGMVWKLADWRLPRWLSSVLYLCLGWLILIAIVPLLHVISLTAFWWLFAGGLAYTIGVIFFGLETVVAPRRYFGMHEIFHLFVMLGSFCHWWLMAKFILFL